MQRVESEKGAIGLNAATGEFTDLIKAGILDRAEAGFRSLLQSPLAQSSLLALLSIYERSRDWQQAADISLQLDQSGQGQFAVRRSHYLCELAATQTCLERRLAYT
ncbi:MAG: hypothetical protein EBS39_09050, partial [Gammaproteobacteria bacterium]|nr:hypothetical protein [Gammaproteobacteria bacterium]